MSDATRLVVAEVRRRAPQAQPRVGVVLGSGWKGLSDHVDSATRIPYAELEGFPRSGVAGHAGELVLGKIGANEVAVLSGRKHVYEQGDVQAMKPMLLALQALGCETLVLTNAAGSLREDMPPGSLMLLTDHINFVQKTPLLGAAGDDRFVNMVDAYDPALRATAHRVAKAAGEELHEGVYLWCLGPQFETPAEIRMFRQLGADAVGMSTVPETILARHAGMKVLALSLVTNLGAGMSSERLSHAHTLAQAGQAMERASKLLANVIGAIAA